jgi:hypothetical protein
MPVKIIQRYKRNRNVFKVELRDGPTWAYEIWIHNRRRVVTGFDSAGVAAEALSDARRSRRLARAARSLNPGTPPEPDSRPRPSAVHARPGPYAAVANAASEPEIS